MTDDFDDVLRSRLQQPVPTAPADAHNVLGQLKPAIRRARIRRGVAVSAATLSLLGVSGVGLAAVTTSLTQEPSEVDILIDGNLLPEATAQTSTTGPDTDETEDSSGEEQTGTAISSAPATTVARSDSTTTTAAPTRSVPTGNPATPGTTSATDPPSSAPTTTRPTSPATTTAPLAPETTTAPPITLPASPTQRTIQSNCGSITVTHDSNSVTLTGTQPGPGFAPDVKNSGLEEVEVGFENGDAECEITAWVESGELRTDVDNHEADEDEGDDDDGDDEDERDGNGDDDERDGNGDDDGD